MDYLFTPWRMQYIQNHESSGGCVFCDALKMADGLENLIIHRAERAFVICNRFPYSTGHLMVVPYQHLSTLEALDQEVRHDLVDLVAKASEVLRDVYKPDAFNIGLNVGAAAGAGVADHLHFHIVPRWNGDANFMTVVGGTRVLPEDLESTYRRVTAAWPK